MWHTYLYGICAQGKNAQLKITDCPYVNIEDKELLSQKPIITMDDNYERVSKELEVEAKQTDFKEAAGNVGGQFESNNGCEVIRLKMMNKPYEMRKDGLFEDGKYCHDSWSKIIIYDYIRRKGNKPLSGDWVTLGYFPKHRLTRKGISTKRRREGCVSFQ